MADVWALKNYAKIYHEISLCVSNIQIIDGILTSKETPKNAPTTVWLVGFHGKN